MLCFTAEKKNLFFFFLSKGSNSYFFLENILGLFTLAPSQDCVFKTEMEGLGQEIRGGGLLQNQPSLVRGQKGHQHFNRVK